MISMKVSDGGRVVIPVEIRRALGLKDGDTVVWELKDGEARLTTRQTRLRRAQELVSTFCSESTTTSVVDELIRERRAESAGQ